MGKGSRPAEAKVLTLVSGGAEAAAAPPVGQPPEPSPVTTVEDEVVATADELEGGVAAAGPEEEAPPREEPRAYPTHLDDRVVADPATPDEMLATLNHLALEDAIDESQFEKLYLHSFSHLGATPGAAHQHWEALKAKQEADREAARQLAEQMTAAIADVRPWNPAEDQLRSRAEVDAVRVAFNAAVDQASKEASTRSWTAAAHLKDTVASELGQRSGLAYDEANGFVSAWAGTSNDHSWRSIALQAAAAEKFGLEPPAYIAKMAGEFAAHPNWENGKGQARRFVDAMYERTQEWLSSRGITEIVLFRGMNGTIGADTTAVDAASEPIEATVHLNPLNSWTGRYDTTHTFAGNNGYTLTARVPASKVIGCCFTGLGCLNEQEFVVVGGAGQQVAAVANKNVRYGHLSGTTWKG
jgi:hypothetical protein